MAESHAENLVQQGRFREAADYLGAKAHLTHLEQVLKAWVEFELDDARQAYQNATALLKKAPDRVSQAYCLAIAGRALGQSGSPHEALGLIRKAVALASPEQPKLEAQLRGIYANSVLAWVGLEAALVELPRVRRSAIRSGDRRTLVEYHTTLARIAVIKGRAQSARKEIETAYNLLDQEPFPDLLWRLRETQSIAALQDGDIQTARACAEECLQLARVSRSKRRIANTLGNLANIAVISGDFVSANSLLSDCLKLLDPHDPVRLAALSTGVNLGLATNDLILLPSAIEQGQATASLVGPEQSYYRLCFELSRIRGLMRFGDVVNAVTSAEVAIREVARLADLDLYDRFRLLNVEALLDCRKLPEAGRLFGKICHESNSSAVDVVAELLRVAALLTHDKAEASGYLSLGYRLLTTAGLLGVRTDVERTAQSRGLDVKSPPCAEQRGDTTLIALGTLLKLGRHPRVLGDGLLAVLSNVEGFQSARLIEEPIANHGRGTTRPTVDARSGASQPDFDLCLGDDGRVSYSLRCSPPVLASSQLAWNSIAEFVRAAVALRTTDPHESSLNEDWDASDPPIQFGMVVAGERSRKLVNDTQKVAPSGFTALITGETGTGKELFARALHEASPRSAKPFMPFNCSAVSREMLDAQLFGYRKGAFTGAAEAFQGVVRAASGGTLFLDEIGEMSLDVQPKLLRFLESGDIHPLGEPRPIHVDVRVVAATNADLEKMVAEGRFREDLFYRLNVVWLQVPALRERREEIPPLVHHFLDKYSREAHKSGIRIADETMEYLILYRWPGNVRQLANEIRRMLALAESGTVLMPEHLSHAIASSRRTIPASERMLAATEVVVRLDQPMSAAMEHIERTMIQYVLSQTGGRVEDAARRLGLSRKGLYLKRQRLHIDSPTEERAVVHQ